MENTYLYINNTTSVYYNNSQQKYYVANTLQKNEDSVDVASKAAETAYKIFSDEISKYISHFKNIAVLTAAGTSMDNGVHSGKTRDGLWNECQATIDEIVSLLRKESSISQANLNSIITNKDIESFLSFVILFEKISNRKLNDFDGQSLKEKLEKQIASACTLQLDESNHHHALFLQKLLARKNSDPRIQLYTTNYDKLFEQAAQNIGATIIDGFSFTLPRRFSGNNFEKDIVYRERTRVKNEESFVPNVFQLYKLHGSIDWEKDEQGSIIQNENTQKPCIVYPASDKYESSYEQPYFEMMAHFQQTLRKEGTLLIVVGFGFKDKHIQNVIKEAVTQNPNFHLLIVCYAQDKGITCELLPDFIKQETEEKIKVIYNNVSILHSTFKDFVENFPMNQSYNTDNTQDHAARL